MSDVDLTRPPEALAAFFELRDWEGMAEGERKLVVEIFEIGRAAGRGERVQAGARAQGAKP